MNEIELRVYYEDTDSGGVVYYANYLKFIERGRTEYLRELGFEQDWLIENKNVIFAVKSLSAKYRYPARFNEQILVQTHVEKIRQASLIFSQKILSLKQNKVLFSSQVTVACLNAKTFKPCAIPTIILEAVNEQ